MISVYRSMVRGRPRWWVDHNVTGRRVRTSFPSEEAARSVAAAVRKNAKKSSQEWVHMPPHERAGVMSTLREIKAAGYCIRDVWDGFRNSPAGSTSKPIDDVVSELIDSKRRGNRRASYLKTLENALRQFISGREKQRIDQFTVEDVEAFAARAKTPSSKKSLVFRCRAMFTFAVRRGYMSSNPCLAVDPITVDLADPVVFSLDQCRDALRWAMSERPRFVPWLTLGLFSGLRPEESDCMSPECIGPGWIKIGAGETKVRRRRVLTMEPVAVEWAQWWQARGIEIPLNQATRRRDQRDLRNALGLSAWPKDVLRHTAATYLLLKYEDAPKVALRLGNSPDVLLRHYRALLTDPNPTGFWSLGPNEVSATPPSG